VREQARNAASDPRGNKSKPKPEIFGPAKRDRRLENQRRTHFRTDTN